MVVAVAVVLVACNKTKNNGELIDFADRFQEKTEIRVWMDDENGQYVQELIKEFNKIHPNIIVTHQHKGTVDSREHLKTFGPSGNGADVFQFPHDHLAQAVLEDLVYPLPQSTKTLLESRAHELGLQIATLSYNAQNNTFDPNDPNAVPTLFAVPVSLESVGLYYNKDLVATPATTFEALLAAGKTWNAEPGHADQGVYYLANSSHWADSYFMQFVYSAFGFTPFGANLNDKSAVGFAKPETQSALTWMRNELKPVTTGSGTHNSVTGGANFEAGKVPYIIAGPWNNEAYKNAELNYGIAPMPTINGKEAKTFAGAMMTAVYKYSNHKEEAIKWVEFLNSDIAMEIQYRMKAKLPALKTELLTNIPGVLDDPLMKGMSEQLKSSVPMPTIPEVTYYWGPGETMITAVWNGTAQSIADEAAKAEASYRAAIGLAS